MTPRRHVETLLLRAGEWITVQHGLDAVDTLVSVYSLEDAGLVAVTVAHTDRDTFELTTSHYVHRETEDGEGALEWVHAREDIHARVVVLV